MPTLETAPVANLVLEQVRVIRAPRARVYQAFSNPELVQQWFGGAIASSRSLHRSNHRS